MPKITFRAATVYELNDEIRAYCGQLNNHLTQAPPDPSDPKYRSPLVEPATPYGYAWLDGNPEPLDSFADAVAKANETEAKVVANRKKPTKKKVEVLDKPLSYPDPEPQPEPQDEVTENTPSINVTPLDTISAEKLKAEVIAQMQDWFAAGKVKLIRDVLRDYGEGAKSFPEIPAEKFLGIDAAIKSGAIA